MADEDEGKLDVQHFYQQFPGIEHCTDSEQVRRKWWEPQNIVKMERPGEPLLKEEQYGKSFRKEEQSGE